jgi:hypothetical protein
MAASRRTFLANKTSATSSSAALDLAYPAEYLEVMGMTPATARNKVDRAGQIVSNAVYLRAAQAYMLISMPTGTSTIFGVFQVISFSQLAVARTPRRR